MTHLPDLTGIDVTAIAAMDKNGVIGLNGDLPWRLPDDLKTFKRMTINRPIIMGRKTYESIGRPLPRRTNIILTRSQTYQADGCLVVHSVAAALTTAVAHIGEHEQPPVPEIIIGGGAAIYELFFPYLTRLVLTHIDCELDGDTWFPQFDPLAWQRVKSSHHPADERHAYSFDTGHYQRIHEPLNVQH